MIKYSKRLQRRLDRDVYPDLNTLPIANWWKINSTNNYAYLLRVNRDVSEQEYTILEGKYDNLMEDYIIRYGMNEQINCTQSECKTWIISTTIDPYSLSRPQL